MGSVPRVYFDTCALNRPFDDQSQPRIRLEAEAVEHLLCAAEEGRLEWISSDVVLFEVNRAPDEERRGALLSLVRRAGLTIALSDEIGERARTLRGQGLRDLDALHLASAETVGAGVLVTTDDRFVRAATGLQPASSVQVKNPVVYEMEVLG
jgi:predicted nucleic acid-binding protein